MSITITETQITHRYLMNRSKLELWRMLADMGTPAEGLRDLPVDKATTKDKLATRIMRLIREQQEQERAKPRAASDPLIGQMDFGNVLVDREGIRWMCVGWSPSDVGRAIVFVREMQLGERVGLEHPVVFVSASAEEIRARFP